MNVSALQFEVFITCITIGFISGIFFLIFLPIRKLISNKIIILILDLFCFIFSTIFYIFIGFKFQFPNLRAYMLLGFLLGLFIYFETLHIPLAKLLKRVYNIISKKMKKKVVG